MHIVFQHVYGPVDIHMCLLLRKGLHISLNWGPQEPPPCPSWVRIYSLVGREAWPQAQETYSM